MYPAMKSLGYQQITSLSSATALTVPAGTSLAIIRPQTQNVRWRDDGTNPSSTVGYPLNVGDELRCDTWSMANIKFIEVTASAALNICYYGIA